MKLDDLVLELRVNDHAFVRLSEFPRIPESERVLAARRLLRAAGKELGVKMHTMNRPDQSAVLGYYAVEQDEEIERLIMAEGMNMLDFAEPTDDD